MDAPLTSSTGDDEDFESASSLPESGSAEAAPVETAAAEGASGKAPVEVCADGDGTAEGQDMHPSEESAGQLEVEMGAHLASLDLGFEMSNEQQAELCDLLSQLEKLELSGPKSNHLPVLSDKVAYHACMTAMIKNKCIQAVTIYSGSTIFCVVTVNCYSSPVLCAVMLLRSDPDSASTTPKPTSPTSSTLPALRSLQICI